jgi:hypothetical protein
MTTVSGAPSSASISIGTTDGLQDALYLKEPGSADPVSMGDIHQGSSLEIAFSWLSSTRLPDKVSSRTLSTSSHTERQWMSASDVVSQPNFAPIVAADADLPLFAIDDAGMGNPRSSDLQTITQVLC